MRKLFKGSSPKVNKPITDPDRIVHASGGRTMHDTNFYDIGNIENFYKLEKNIIDYYKKDIENYKGKWLGTDNPTNWEKNKQNHQGSSDFVYWENNPITYEFNNHQFRTPDDFNTEDEGIIFLGCSHTSGIGLHWNQTWVHHICKRYKRKAWNLAIGGMGIQTCYRNLVIWTQKERRLKAKKVLLLIPHFERWELASYVRNKKHNYTPVTVQTLETFLGKNTTPYNVMTELLFSETTSFWNMRSQLDAIRVICMELGMDLHVVTTLPILYQQGNNLPVPNCARDFAHCSPAQQQQIAEKFVYLIDNNIQYHPNTHDFMSRAWEAK